MFIELFLLVGSGIGARCSGVTPRLSNRLAASLGVILPFAKFSFSHSIICAAWLGLRPLRLCGSTNGVTVGTVMVGAGGAACGGVGSFMMGIPFWVRWGLFEPCVRCNRRGSSDGNQ
jgi:hypothetical protein